MKCGSCGRDLRTGARKCVYCGSTLGEGGKVVAGPREVQAARARARAVWGRRFLTIVILMALAAVALSLSVIDCMTCGPETEQRIESCPTCNGKGKLTPVKFVIAMFTK